MTAVKLALDENAKYDMDFVNNIRLFLNFFGMKRDSEELISQYKRFPQPGTETWYLERSNKGEQLLNAECYLEAENIFQEILVNLDKYPSYEKCVILRMLGLCYSFQGKSKQAIETYRQGLAIAEKLESSEYVKQEIGALQNQIGILLAEIGEYKGAYNAYKVAQSISKELGYLQGYAATLFQIGTLEMIQGNLKDAIESFYEVIDISKRLNEPTMEANAWHQLGDTLSKAKQIETAELAYRNAAQILEKQGDLANTVQIWNNLALLMQDSKKSDEAERWYRKALKSSHNVTIRSSVINNLASLLKNNPSRVPEARQLAEEALAIKKTLDPDVATIWTTYGILSEIAEKQHQPQQMREYRRWERKEKWNFAGTKYELQQYKGLIDGIIVAAQGHESAKQFVRQEQEEMRQTKTWRNLADAIDRILAGERNEDVLCENLRFDHAVIVMAVLEGI